MNRYFSPRQGKRKNESYEYGKRNKLIEMQTD